MQGPSTKSWNSWMQPILTLHRPLGPRAVRGQVFDKWFWPGTTWLKENPFQACWVQVCTSVQSPLGAPNSSACSNASALLFGLNLLALFECELPERDTTMLTCQGRRDRHYYLLKQPSTEKAFWTGKPPQKSNLYVWKYSKMQFWWVREPILLSIHLCSSILATHVTHLVSSQHLLHSWMQSALISCSHSSLFSPMLPFLPHFSSFPLLLNFCKTCSFEPATNGGKMLCANTLSLLLMPAFS